MRLLPSLTGGERLGSVRRWGATRMRAGGQSTGATSARSVSRVGINLGTAWVAACQTMVLFTSVYPWTGTFRVAMISWMSGMRSASSGAAFRRLLRASPTSIDLPLRCPSDGAALLVGLQRGATHSNTDVSGEGQGVPQEGGSLGFRPH